MGKGPTLAVRARPRARLAATGPPPPRPRPLQRLDPLLVRSRGWRRSKRWSCCSSTPATTAPPSRDDIDDARRRSPRTTDLRRGSKSRFRELFAATRPVEYLRACEWTTGLRQRSGGHRRLHVHFLLKGLDLGEVATAKESPAPTGNAVTGANRIEVANREPPAAPPRIWRSTTKRPSQAPPATGAEAGPRLPRLLGPPGPIAGLREQAKARARTRLRNAADRTVKGLSTSTRPYARVSQTPGFSAKLNARLSRKPCRHLRGSHSERIHWIDRPGHLRLRCRARPLRTPPQTPTRRCTLAKRRRWT